MCYLGSIGSFSILAEAMIEQQLFNPYQGGQQYANGPKEIIFIY